MVTLVLSCTVLSYGDLLAENCEFFLPHSHFTPSLGVLDELFLPKARVGEDFVILACFILTQCQRVTNGQTDGRTDNPIVANTGLCIASYADAL